MTGSKVIPIRPRASMPGSVTARPASRHKIYAYLRVSTDAQDLGSQKVGIVDYAKEHSLRIDQWVEETASGGIDAGKRALGMELLPKLRPGDVLITAELSRLGRSTADVLTTLKQLTEQKVKVHVVKGHFQIDDSINSKILTTVLGLAAEIERDLISQRAREGQARAKAAGKHIGRPRIERDQDRRSKLDSRAGEIKTLAEKGVTKLNLARIFECDWATMNIWLTRHGVRVRKGVS